MREGSRRHEHSLHPFYNELQDYPPLPRCRSLLLSGFGPILRQSSLLSVLRLPCLRIRWIRLGVPWIRCVVGIEQGRKGTRRSRGTCRTFGTHRK
ncbi:hypothetical protein PMAYCL1PPCAC_11585, partial [Pristionchus mayeri]